MHGPTSKWLSTMQTGQQLFQQGRLPEAIAAFIQATRVQPERAEGWTNLGVCLGSINESVEALAALDRAVQIEPELALCHLARGRVLFALNKIDDARQALEKAVTIQRLPVALNDLANLLRVRRQFAEACMHYHEAITLAPGNTLFEVNLATCLIELGKYQDARKMLDLLAAKNLPPIQRHEVDNTLNTLGEFERLDCAIGDGLTSGEHSRLEELLWQTPDTLLQPDELVMARIHSYANSARALSHNLGMRLNLTLPHDWPQIEAFFMVPVIETVADYKAVRDMIDISHPETGEWLESLNMINVVKAMRAESGRFDNPVKAESLLRLWHGMACRGLEDFLPGHFKINQNMVVRNPSITRAQPSRVAGSIRLLLGELRHSLPAGLPRALFLFLGVLDIHPFSDGNGRIALALMNRELECAGLMPTVFPSHLGLKGSLADAMVKVRHNGGDLSPLILPVLEGQHYASRFCNELGSD